MHFEWTLYERCTEALFIQRPSVFPREQSWGAVQRYSTYSAQGKIVVSLIKTTTLHLDTLYICHFDFRSIKRVHIQILYLGYFSKTRKIPRTHF